MLSIGSSMKWEEKKTEDPGVRMGLPISVQRCGRVRRQCRYRHISRLSGVHYFAPYGFSDSKYCLVQESVLFKSRFRVLLSSCFCSEMFPSHLFGMCTLNGNERTGQQRSYLFPGDDAYGPLFFGCSLEYELCSYVSIHKIRGL